MQTLKTEAPALSSSQPAIPHRDPRYKQFVGWLLTISRIRLAWFYLVGTWRIYSVAIGSCRARIRLQSPTNIFEVGTGLALQRDRTGCLRPNIRTQARAVYTEKLLATYSWVDSCDLRVFLMGFDAGEQWTLYTQSNEPEKRIESLPYFTSDDKNNLTLDMLKRQWYKSQYESARHQDPSQSD
jgi:hypothetical protein